MTSAHSFPGFPPQARWFSLPEAVVTALLPEMDDLAEVKVTLYIFRVLYQKPGYPRFLLHQELERDRPLLEMVGGVEGLHQALDRAVQRGTLLRLAVKKGDREHLLYLVNDEPSRQAMEKVVKGQMSLGEFTPLPPTGPAAAPPPNIYALYEDNIGLLTPMVAEELKEAEKQYPASWIEDAFKEAVAQNKRRWRYISRILERWASEGRGDGTVGRHPEKDANKYIKGKYGHIVQR